MSSEADDDASNGIYEVERILFERQDSDGANLYLIKWKDYPDEQCTWEPRENFIETDVLKQWEEQKATGDILDKYDLHRIQRQMDAWQAQNLLGASADVARDSERIIARNSEAGAYSSTHNGNVDLRARKRPRLADESAATQKKGTARLVNDGKSKKVADNSKQDPPHRRLSSPAGDGAGLKKSAPPLSSRGSLSKDALPSASISTKLQPNVSTLANSTSAMVPPAAVFARQIPPPQLQSSRSSSSRSTLPNKTLGQEAPPRFYAPDTGPRVRASASDGSAKREVSGAAFKTLRQMNNARKRQKDEAPAIPIATFALGEDPPPSRPTERPAVKQRNKSTLFFDDLTDEDDNSDTEMQDVRRELPGESVENYTNPLEQNESGKLPPSQEEIFNSEAMNVDLRNGTTRLSYTTKDHSDRQPLSATAPSAKTRDLSALDVPLSVPLQVPPTLGNQPEAPAVHGNPALAEQADLSPDERSTEARRRTSSLFNRRLSLSDTFLPPAGQNSEVPKHQDPIPTLPRGPATGRRSQYQTDSGRRTPPAVDYMAPKYGEVVTVAGKQWVKGDIVMDISVHGQNETNVKLLHIPWHYARPLVTLKEPTMHKLPIPFQQTVSRQEYDDISKKWFSYFAFGALEAFKDTTVSLNLLAIQLESRDVAALWQHPKDDVMLVLYSRLGRSWRDLPSKPVRYGESRLQVAFRQKFGEHQDLSNSDHIPDKLRREQNEARENDAQARDTIESREEDRRGRRSRRSSVVSMDGYCVSSRASSSNRSPFDQILSPRSPGAQIRADLSTKMSIHNDDVEAHKVDNSATAPPHIIPSAQLEGTPAAPISHPVASRKTEGSLMFSPTVNIASSVVSDPRRAARSPALLSTRRAKFVGLAKEASEITWTTPVPNISSTLKYVLLAYGGIELGRIAELKTWLVEKGLQTECILDLSNSGHWSQFVKKTADHAGIVIFDIRYPVYSLDGLAKLLDREHISCWRIDYAAKSDKPIPMTRIFPRGTVKVFVEGSFVDQPKPTLILLKTFKKANESRGHKYASSRLILPPRILDSLREQAIRAREDDMRMAYLHLAKIIEDMDLDHDEYDSGTDVLSDLKFSVLKPTWREVYPDIPEVAVNLSAMEQRKREDDKDDAMIQYLGAWALQNLENHRKFQVFLINSNLKKPENCGHVRLQLTKGCADNLLKQQQKAAQERRGRGDGEEKSPRARSRSKSRTRTGMATTSPWAIRY